jgi:agmatinase
VVYLTFDIDAIDQSEAPGTDYPTPGGLTAWEALYLVHRLARTGRIRWMDLMEVSPPHDIADHTAKLGAELVAQALFGLVVAKAAG